MSSQMIELIILFAIAAFVLFRLKSVIGTRTGYEAPPDHPQRDRADDAKKHCRLIIDRLDQDAYKPEAYAALIRVLLKEGDGAKAAERYGELRERFPVSRQARELAPLFSR